MAAIKTLNKSRIKGESRLLRKEIDILKHCDHPNIIKLYDVYEDHQYIHLALELCEGGELFERVLKAGYFSENDAAFHMRKILSAISHLH